MTYSIAVAAAAQLALSTALLIWASLAHGRVPYWAGPLDGVVAFTFVGTALWLRARTEDARARTLPRVYWIASTIPALAVVLVWWFRERVDLNILLPGVAWRLFVLVELLPGLAAAAGSARKTT